MSAPLPHMLKRYAGRHALSLCATSLLFGCTGVLITRLLATSNALAASGVSNIRAALLEAGLDLLALALCNGIAHVLLLRFGAEVVAELRAELAQKFLAIDYEKVANKTHVIFTAIIHDLSAIGPFVLLGPHLLYTLLLIALYSFTLIRISLSLYLVYATFMAVGFGASFLLGRSLLSPLEELRHVEDGVYEQLRSIGQGKKEFSLDRTRAPHFFGHVLLPEISRARGLMQKLALVWAANENWSTVTRNATIFVVVYVGYVALHLSAATVVQFILMGLLLLGPLQVISELVHPVVAGLASLRHLEQIGIDLEADFVEDALGTRLESEPPRDWKVLELDAVEYQYEEVKNSERTFGVGPVTLSIRRSETIFIVGGNGCGKSTLLLLLCGLIAPKGGEIRLDGEPVRTNLRRYRDLFCGTFSDCFVFRHVLDSLGTIKSDEEVRALLSEYALDGLVQVDRGVLSKLELSTGQRKRLALIQSHAQDRDIYFFDEWAADQDPSFREYFYLSVLSNLKRRGKTVIVITHDDRYFHIADRVVKLDMGRMVSDTRTAHPKAETVNREPVRSVG